MRTDDGLRAQVTCRMLYDAPAPHAVCMGPANLASLTARACALWLHRRCAVFQAPRYCSHNQVREAFPGALTRSSLHRLEMARTLVSGARGPAGLVRGCTVVYKAWNNRHWTFLFHSITISHHRHPPSLTSRFHYSRTSPTSRCPPRWPTTSPRLPRAA